MACQRTTYDAQARADIASRLRSTGELPLQLIDPEDVAAVQSLWQAASHVAEPTPANTHSRPEPTLTSVPWEKFKAEILKLYQPPMRAAKTLGGLKHALRHVDAMGVAFTSDLTPALIADLVAGQVPTKSANTIHGLLRYVQAACSYAEKMGYLRISPFRVRGLSTYARREPPRGRKHASREEIRRVLDHMREQAQADGWKGWKAKRLYALTATLAYTGMRAGEAIWLQAADVDIAEGIIWVVSRPEHRTKTDAAAQPLPMRRLSKGSLRSGCLTACRCRPSSRYRTQSVPGCFPRHAATATLHGVKVAQARTARPNEGRCGSSRRDRFRSARAPS